MEIETPVAPIAAASDAAAVSDVMLLVLSAVTLTATRDAPGSRVLTVNFGSNVGVYAVEVDRAGAGEGDARFTRGDSKGCRKGLGGDCRCIVGVNDDVPPDEIALESSIFAET